MDLSSSSDSCAASGRLRPALPSRMSDGEMEWYVPSLLVLIAIGREFSMAATLNRKASS